MIESTRGVVCLTMIVKDEEHVIERCLERVLPMIDCYAIVDTGSTDNTEAVAKRMLAGTRGVYAHSDAPWTGYADARNGSLSLAEEVCKGEPVAFAFVVDADDLWSGEIRLPECPPASSWRADAYALWFERPGAKWSTTRLLRLGKGIRYDGVVHERPVNADGSALVAELIEGLAVTSPNDGATSKDPEKYLHHARMLSQALAVDPTDTRSAFYLAQSYRDHGDDQRASLLYLARAAMGPGTYPEEIYCSFLEAGRAFLRLGNVASAKRALLNAHNVYPERREAMAEIARVFAVQAATSPTVGTLFVETNYDDDLAEIKEAAQ